MSMRDRNLRSGDLHEELGILLLKTVAFVAPVPRPEDVGTDAFATLIRPEGSRRLIPGRSFLVQLKAASERSVSYDTPDKIAWITALDAPLFIGSVNLEQARIELFSTQELHRELLLQRGPIGSTCKSIELLLDLVEAPDKPSGVMKVCLRRPVHAWSLAESREPGFLERAHAILRPHIESLQRNLPLRRIQYLNLLWWQTGHPPVDGGTLMYSSQESHIADTLQAAVPYVRRMLMEAQNGKPDDDFRVLVAFVDLMRRWGIDPDPGGSQCRRAAYLLAGFPGAPVEETIRRLHTLQPNRLDLSRLRITDEVIAAIPDDVEQLDLANARLTDAGAASLVRLKRLRQLNLAKTTISDEGLVSLAELPCLESVCVEGTQIPIEGVNRLRAARPEISVVQQADS
jgi:hypothetical protein